MAVNNLTNTYGLGSVGLLGNEKNQTGKSDENKATFAQYLNNALDQVNQLQLDSEQLGKEFAAGRTDNIHQVTIAAEKADIALQFTMQIRNKIMDAYSEIMRMQI